MKAQLTAERLNWAKPPCRGARAIPKLFGSGGLGEIEGTWPRARQTARRGLEIMQISGRGGSLERRSRGAQIIRGGFARSSIGHDLKRDLLSLVETVQSGAFDRADMHENILAAIIRLDETEAFLAVEPLYGSLRHEKLLSDTCLVGPRGCAAGSVVENWKKVFSPTQSTRRGQVVRPKLDGLYVAHRHDFHKRAGLVKDERLAIQR